MTIEEKKEEFITRLRSTERKGVENVIESLDKLGFFAAPASTRFHLSEKGGLLTHSLNVCNVALNLREMMIGMDESLKNRLPVNSVIIAALLHDVCKAEVYRPTIKRQKGADGNWRDVEGYDVDYSHFPLGHGEKSVIRLLKYGFDMEKDEIIAIRWHMTAWDLAFNSPESRSNLTEAANQCPLLTLLQASDGLASHLLEK